MTLICDILIIEVCLCNLKVMDNETCILVFVL